MLLALRKPTSGRILMSGSDPAGWMQKIGQALATTRSQESAPT